MTKEAHPKVTELNKLLAGDLKEHEARWECEAELGIIMTLNKTGLKKIAFIDELLVRYVESLVYQAVAENMASEQSARMVAMKAATDNAGNVINELKLVYNKTRQAGITKELSEIVAGAAAATGN